MEKEQEVKEEQRERGEQNEKQELLEPYKGEAGKDGEGERKQKLEEEEVMAEKEQETVEEEEEQKVGEQEEEEEQWSPGKCGQACQSFHERRRSHSSGNRWTAARSRRQYIRQDIPGARFRFANSPGPTFSLGK